MNIYQAQRLAKYNDDHLEFLADFPNGTFRCKWLDAYFGFLTVPDIEDLTEHFNNSACAALIWWLMHSSAHTTGGSGDE